jgi:hypothetical protein
MVRDEEVREEQARDSEGQRDGTAIDGAQGERWAT